MAFLLTRLLGWHWAFLPTLAAELIPGVDLLPTWTAAVWYITRQKSHPQEPEILPLLAQRPNRADKRSLELCSAVSGKQ